MNRPGGNGCYFPIIFVALEKVAELQVNIKGKGWKMIIVSESDGSGVIETRR